MAWVQPPQFGSCPSSNNFGVENREKYLLFTSRSKYLQVRGAGDHGGVLRGGVRHVGPVHCRCHHTGHYTTLYLHFYNLHQFVDIVSLVLSTAINNWKYSSEWHLFYLPINYGP